VARKRDVLSRHDTEPVRPIRSGVLLGAGTASLVLGLLSGRKRAGG